MPANEEKQKRPSRAAQLLSLCLRAGKLALGYDPVKEAAQKGKASLLVASVGASDNTMKRMRYMAEDYAIPLLTIEESLDDLWYILGKRVGVMCVMDQALGDKIVAEVAQATEQRAEESETT